MISIGHSRAVQTPVCVIQPTGAGQSAVTQSWHLPPSVSGQVIAAANARANSRFRRIPIHPLPRSQSRPASSRCGGSPGSGDDLLPCLAATLARCGCPGLARQPARGPRAARACGGATGRVACDGRKRPRHRGSRRVSGASCSRTEVLTQDHGSPPMTPAYVRRPIIPGPAGLDNHRNPVMTSHHPGGEPGHTLIDTRMGDHDDNRHRSARAPRVPLGGG